MQPFAEGRPHSRRAKVAEVVGRGGPVVWDSLAREGEEEALRSEAWSLLLRPLGSDGAVALCEGGALAACALQCAHTHDRCRDQEKEGVAGVCIGRVQWVRNQPRGVAASVAGRAELVSRAGPSSYTGRAAEDLTRSGQAAVHSW